jgi:exodeoxyribonuclease VII large subunit
VTIYEPRGAYQIDVAQLQPTGVGELQAAFERLKQRLLAEGLFDPAHKKRIPPFPHAIGLVTSPTGAAIRDLVTVIRRRFPPVDLILYPVRVQGSGAAEEIAGAIRDFNEYGRIEVMIVGRGGGSLEDLWAFNEEVVARAIYDSRIPVISAVGHEVDFTIADFVADLRAPTPSAAGEMVVHDYREIVENVRNFLYNIEQSLMAMIRTQIDEVHSVVRSYAFNRPLDLLHRFAQALDEADRGLARAIGRRTESERERIRSLGERLRALDPQAVLGRGYAIVTRESTAIGSAAELRSKDDISVRFHDGSVPAVVR